MRIGELAQRSGVSPRSLRYYEEQGLLSPVRDAAGHRRYDESDVDRVVEIQELFAAGLCSTVVRDVLPGVLDPTSGDVARVAGALAEVRERLHGELRHVERELEVLGGLQERLGLAPDTHVKAHADGHDDTTAPAPADHRDLRLR